MWNYFKFEWKQFFYNKKNIAIYALLLFATIFYAFKIAPNYDPIEKIDRDEIQARYDTRQEFIENVEKRDIVTLHPATVQGYYMYVGINPLDKQRLEALDEGNLKKYARVTSDWYFQTNIITNQSENISYNSRYYIQNPKEADYNGFYYTLEQAARYEAYAKMDDGLSLNAFEGRTALQTFERLMNGYLPIVLLICSLLLGVDILSKDRRHPSILKGFPVSDWTRVLTKGAVAFIGSIALFGPLLIGFIIIGCQSGFGQLNYPSPRFTTVYNWVNDKGFEAMSLGSYLSQSTALLIVWYIVLIGLLLLAGMVFRQEMVGLVLGFFILFAERFYATRGVGFFMNVENYPTTYVQVGKIVSRYQNYFLTTENVVLSKGFLTVGLVAVVTWCVLLILSKLKRYKLLK